ncbi:MAG: DUF4179 domain-containing protein [Massiliimalia sp.]|jgi:hypothetical protein
MKKQRELWETDYVPMTTLSPEEQERLIELSLKKANLPALSQTNSGGIHMKKQIKKRISIIAAAAAIAASSLTVGAAVYFHWDERLLDYFHADSSQAELLSGAQAQIGLTATDNGVSISVVQTVSDAYGTYILAEVTLPENMVWKEEYTFERLDVSVPDAKYTGWSYTVLNHSQNKVSLLIEAETDCELNGKTISLNLQNISTVNQGTFTPVIEGTWQFQWTENYENLSRSYKPENAYLNLTDSTESNASVYQIDEMVLSPLSLRIMFQGEPADPTITGTIQPDGSMTLKPDSAESTADSSESELSDSGNQSAPDFFVFSIAPDSGDDITISLNQKDGTQITSSQYRMATNTDDQGSGQIRWDFGQVIDPEQIESITVNGVTIPLE